MEFDILGAPFQWALRRRISMNRVLAVIASLGATCMTGQALGADSAGHSALSRRHLSGCMSTRMSASKLMSYYEAMKVCKDQLINPKHNPASTASRQHLADGTTADNAVSVTASKSLASATPAKQLTSVTSMRDVAAATTTQKPATAASAKAPVSAATDKRQPSVTSSQDLAAATSPKGLAAATPPKGLAAVAADQPTHAR